MKLLRNFTSLFLFLLMVCTLIPMSVRAEDRQETSDQTVSLSHSQLDIQTTGLEDSENDIYYWIVELTNTSDQEINIYQEIYSDLSLVPNGKDNHRQLELSAYDLSNQEATDQLLESVTLNVDQSIVLRLSVQTDADLSYDLKTYDQEIIEGYGDKTDNISEAKEEAKEEKSEEAVVSDDVPREYESALNKAYSYAETMFMSKAGLYDQLVSEYGEQFSPEAADYAIETIEWDWKANALEKAKSYQDVMDMSPAAIYDQLISDYGEQFTPEEADYAIEHLNE